MRAVPSVEPVSTPINSPARPRTESRQRARLRSSFFTIMQRLSAQGILGMAVPIIEEKKASLVGTPVRIATIRPGRAESRALRRPLRQQAAVAQAAEFPPSHPAARQQRRQNHIDYVRLG